MANGYYMFDCHIVNKGKQSAVAMAAYRSDEKLYSDIDGLTKHYKPHNVEPESFILKPDHAPDWTTNRETLWNEVEAFENRDNARIARNVMIPLPNEMTEEQQTKTAKEYVQETFVDEGMVADVSIHRDEKHNPHAHVLLTVRPFDKNGNWETRKSKRVPMLDEDGKQLYDEKGWRRTRSVKINDWDDKNTFLKWRENWASKLNEKAKQFNINKTYSHKSYKDQGKIQKPLLRLNREEYQLDEKHRRKCEKEGKVYSPQTFFAKKNAEIKAYNKQIQNVSHLDDYKTEQDFNRYLNDVRKNLHTDPQEIEATQLLVDRAKGYVDYDVARRMYNDFHQKNNKWERKLERDFAYLEAQKNTFSAIVKQYHEEPSRVEQYGYSVENFREEMKNDLNRYKEEYAQKKEEKAKFDELKKATEISLGHQKQLLNEEFNAVYNPQKSFMDEEKYFAISQLKRNNIYIPEDRIKYEYKNYFEGENSQNYIPAWKQAKDMLKSIRIYDNTVNRIEKTNLDNINPEERVRLMIEAHSYRQLKKSYEKHIRDLEPLIDQEMAHYLPDYEAMKSMKIQSKTAVLDEYHSLSVDKQREVSGDELVATVYHEQKHNAEWALNQSENADSKQESENYKMVAQESQEISDGLSQILYKFMDTETLEDEHQKHNQKYKKEQHMRRVKRMKKG